MAKPKKPVPNNKVQIAERLKKARELLGLTQQQVADKAHVSRSAVVHYEKANVIPGGQELIGLAKALNRSPNYILSGSEEFFDSPSPEHALVTGMEEGAHIARIVLCIKILDREVAEALSALVMALVKAKVPKKDYPAFIEALEGISGAIANMTPELDAMVEQKDAAGAFDHIKKPPRKRKK